MKTLIKNGRVVDPANGVDDTLDVLIEDGKIAKLGRDIPKTGAEVIEAAGKIVAPGFIDMHVHLREPGREEAETIKTGTEAAAAGGFTAVACMPNTNPVNDNESVTQFIIKKAAAEGSVHVYPVGAITKGSKGESLSEIGELHRAGCVAISDDGRDVMDNLLMRRAMEYASMFDMPVIDHCEAADLSGEGVMNEGAVSTALGMKPIPAAAEEIMVQRNILLARDTGCRVHIAHISTEESVEMVRRAKKRGIKVTCEATPHHFTLTDEECRSFDTNYKMKPPLRSDKDRKAILKGIKDGTIDCIATDHAPHSEDFKNVEFDYAAFGIVGLETAVPLALDRLVNDGVIDIVRLVEMLSMNPARILGVPGGTLGTGALADITILDNNRNITVNKDKFRSKSRNTPFHGMMLKGAPVMTIVSGRIVFSAED
jgi:dihydroorotase